MGLDFRHTGLPRGHSVKSTVAAGNTPYPTNSTPDLDYYITSIQNTHAYIDSYVSIAGARIHVAYGKTLSFPIPFGPIPSFYIETANRLNVTYVTVEKGHVN